MGSEDETLAGTAHATARSEPSDGVGTRLARGTSIDRYVTLGVLGSGAMGIVYLAYDPDLDRRVAVKLLQREGADANARLLREARAMARLNHPNVVSVHDVGEHEGAVWVAMELVEGRNLRAWRQEETPTWSQAVAVFRPAGEGLAAAHDVGLVHRDFKPDNVLVSDDGRVLVTDFGLARPSEETSLVMGADVDLGASVAATATGMLSGTPAYMSPEGFRGQPATAASDQFSYCVALYEAVYGERPFPADSLVELSARVTDGAFEPPAEVRVPSWLRDALARGLSVEPQARFPSMRALLTALEPPKGSTARRAVGIAVVALAVGAAAATAADRDPGPTCDGGASRVAEVWTPSRADEIAAAFAATEVPTAVATFDRVRTRLDGWTAKWRAAHRDACEATHVRGEQSAARLDERMTCLSRGLQRVGALVDELARPDAALVARAEGATAGLPSVEACRDPAAIEVIDDPTVRAQVDRAREHFAVATARNETGRYAGGVEAADAALEALGDATSSLRVELLVTKGQLLQRAGQFDAAEGTLRAALAAELDTPLPYSAAEAWLTLAMVVGEGQARTEEASALLLPTELAAKRAGEPGLMVRYHLTAGSIAENAHRPDEAIEHLRRAIELAGEDMDDERRDVLYGNLGNALYEAGRYEEAESAFVTSLESSRRAFGDEHPSTATSMANLGRALSSLGRNDEAGQMYGDSLRLRQKLLGPRHPQVGDSHLNLATVLDAQGEHEAALEHTKAALEIWTETLAADHPYLAIAHGNLGVQLMALGRTAEAIAEYETALALRRKRYGDGALPLATPMANLANALTEQGDIERALPLYEEARAIRAAHQGTDHPDYAYPLLGRALALLKARRPADALVPAEEALALREKSPLDPALMYQTYMAVARALDESGRDPVRAAELVDRARKAFAETGLDPAEATELAAWNHAHGG